MHTTAAGLEAQKACTPFEPNVSTLDWCEGRNNSLCSALSLASLSSLLH